MMLSSKYLLYQRIFAFLGLCCLLSTACLSHSQAGPDDSLYSIGNPHHKSKRSFGLVFRVWEGRELSLSVVDLSYREPVLTPIFHGPSSHRYLISPDGKHLAIRKETEVVIVELPSLTPVATFDAGPAPTHEFIAHEIEDDIEWSPHGTQLAFVVFKNDLRVDIMVYDLQHKELVTVTNDLSRKSGLTWSPDGRLLAFAVLPACGRVLTECDLTHVTWHIAVSDLQSPQYRLISDETTLPKHAWFATLLCNLSWSPDARYIVYQILCPAHGPSTMGEMFVSAVNASETALLTPPARIDYVDYYGVTWSTDSHYLLIGYARTNLADLEKINGYILFRVGEWDEGHMVAYPTLNPPSSQWDNQRGYGIGSLSGVSRGFLIHWEGEHITVLSEVLPPLFLDGIWIDGDYISILENRIVKLVADTGELVELGVTVDEKMELIGTWGER